MSGLLRKLASSFAASPTFHARFFVPVVIITLVATFGLIVVGGIVRVTDSGLGCPGWPLCYGRVIPPLEKHAIIEYSHRFLASVVSVLVFGDALIAWLYYRRQKVIFSLAMLSAGLLVLQVALGGLTVAADLSPQFVTAHLATAETLLAVLAVLTVYLLVDYRHERSATQNKTKGETSSIFMKLLVVALVASFGLLMSGSYVVGSSSTPACGGWPLCNGDVFPGHYHQIVAMSHRYLALLVGLLMLAVAWTTWRRRNSTPVLKALAIAILAIFGGQVAVGAATVFSGFDSFYQSFHLVMASAVWVIMVILASYQFITTRRLVS